MNATQHVNRISAKRGATLVEALTALCVLGLCVGGACQVALSAKTLSDDARSHYLAVNIAKNRIERARAIDYDALDQFVEERVRVNSSGVPDNRGPFRRTTSVSSLGDNLRQVTVKVEILDRVTMRFGGAQEEIPVCLARLTTRA